ncbi:acyl-CoA dehydrogenase family protein, partial [uncultured Acinetobacter sp.]|uniref:acyl-CoA dehydrogenase family protein n=1 Tax=uncultured Acinetobacter sp. TaxID=165433 RepID=UPI002590E4A0
MSNMVSKAQGLGLSLITKLAGSDVLDQLKLRKFVERSLYQGSKTGFKALSKAQKTFKSNSIDRQRLPRQNKDLFDLSLTEEQTMTREAMRKFAQEVLYIHAHQADHDEQFPKTIWQYLDELGLNYYALPEAAGGVASEQNIVSNILIAEDLAQGDFSLAAGILSSFSAINAITRWGSQSIQSRYLSAFAEDSQLKATFATQENTAAFNPFQLKTTAKREGDHFYLDGQKTLVL